MDLQLTDRAMICTGAAGGIGRPTAELLAREGARMLVVDRDEDAVAEVVAALTGSGHAGLACDLRDPEAAELIVDRARATLGGVDGLVQLAAIMVPRDLDDIDVELWDLHHEVNVRGSFLLARAAAAVMTQAGGGSIVLVSSTAWLTGGRHDRLHYAATKGAITTLVRGLATALGPRGIRVNGVAPGAVDTPMMNAGVDAEERRAVERLTPLGRFARPEEIATVIAFLAAPTASFMSGATVAVSGGLIAH